MIEPITVAIAQAVFIKGLKKDVSDVDIEAISKYVRQYITLHKPLYRIGEIVQAIELGSLGELSEPNDLNGLSPEIIVKWIHRFHERFRKEALHKQKVHEAKLSDIETESQKDNGKVVLMNAINDLYVWFIQGGIVEQRLNYTPNPTHLCGIYFSFLEKEGKIKMNNEDKQMILDIAIGKVSEEAPDSSDRTAYKKFFETLESQQRSMAKKIALIQYFGEWKGEGKTTIF